jgi:hypothetical protein
VSAPAIASMLETELWQSFVSLLRSYAAAANLNLEEHARVEQAETSAALIAGDTRLELRFDPETSTVNWRMQSSADQPITGSFAFLPEGTIDINGRVQDLDHVAIELVAKATGQGKGTR